MRHSYPRPFESVWIRQFHRRHPGPDGELGPDGRPVAGGLPSPLLFLGWLAARTTRLRLGTSVVTLPLESPVRVAEDAAVLDAISGGRVGSASRTAAAGPDWPSCTAA